MIFSALMWIVVLILALFTTPAAAQIAYDVTPIAGQLRDDYPFTDIRGLWGDGQDLYVIEGTSLHRVDLATREVSTVTRLLGSAAYTANVWPGRWGFGGIWGDSSFI